MIAYLLDTNVLSELRKGRRCDPSVALWQAGLTANDQFVSVISLMEIQSGILAARRSDERFADLLADWYENRVKPTFDGRVLGIDLEIAERCSLLMNQRTRGLSDALIAATAHVLGFTLVTRNVDDFRDTGIRLVNPWQTGPAS
ncbi:MAG: VapC toxin protein [Akkermansiaceae bacterium]|nr:VapC toxin protein [Akkermansiaceae bacterium]